MNIIGISAFFHDSAAVLLQNGKVTAAAQEERFTRKKGDASFPRQSLKFCLNAGGIDVSQVDAVVYYEKPWLAFERILESALDEAPFGLLQFLAAVPPWMGMKLNMRRTIRKSLYATFGPKAKIPPILFSQHHLSHAASAFFASPFPDSAVLCIDGVGERATNSVWIGRGNQLIPQWQIDFPHSLGLLYAAFTWFCGFKINSGEYKLMGLAPFGKPRFQKLIEENLICIADDGSFRLNMDYFEFSRGLQMVNSKFERLFGVGPRPFEGKMDPIYMDLASSIQAVTEKVMVRLAKTIRQETGMKNLCLAGGVALNCVANGKISQERIFDQLFIQPAAGDAGGALGAALVAWYMHFKKERQNQAPDRDSMRGALLGPSFSESEIKAAIDRWGAKAHRMNNEELIENSARLLSEQNVIGWFHGAMEFGPRALGSRSILGDPRNPEMKQMMNLKIKFREGFRPFAPIVLAERAYEQFDLKEMSPYMLLVADTKVPESLPAITHVDGSARVQTVDKETNPLLHDLLSSFEQKTGCPVLVNTSFNVRGEPIVLDPMQALACLFNTDIDALVMGNYIVRKHENAHIKKDEA